jgi:hypothetical protein
MLCSFLTMGHELEGSLLEVEELLDLDVEREGGAAGERGGAGDGEVGAAGEVGAQGLQVRAQVAHVQALTCTPWFTRPARPSDHRSTRAGTPHPA